MDEKPQNEMHATTTTTTAANEFEKSKHYGKQSIKKNCNRLFEIYTMHSIWNRFRFGWNNKQICCCLVAGVSMKCYKYSQTFSYVSSNLE